MVQDPDTKEEQNGERGEGLPQQRSELRSAGEMLESDATGLEALLQLQPPQQVTTSLCLSLSSCTGLPRWFRGKESPCQCRRCRRHGFNQHRLGRSPGKANGNPLRYSCLEYPMDREAWGGYSLWGPHVHNTMGVSYTYIIHYIIYIYANDICI